MEKFEIQFSDDVPKYIQISNSIKELILDGRIEQDEKLPPIRKLAEFLSVNKDTIIRAYDKLESEGAAYQKMGSGTYAKRRDEGLIYKREYSKILKKIAEKEFQGYIDFSGENVNIQYFPVKVFKDIINQVIDRDDIGVFVEKESIGFKGLRECINERFWDSNMNINRLLIVSGAQQGIDIISKAIININDNVIVERPTYGGAISVFKYRRANIFEISIDEDGMNLDELEEILKKNKIKALYTMSYFQNPTGISMSMDKKKRLIQLANEYNFYIIEDDYLSELIYDKDIEYHSLKSMDIHDKVIYIKSFSKLFLPGIRLGYVIGTDKTTDAIIKSKINTDIATSSLMQRALDLYIRKGYWEEQISSMKREYSYKYKELLKIITEELGEYVDIIDPKGGMSFFIKLNEKLIDDKELFYRCLNRKVVITPGRIFFKRIKKYENYFRISFGKASVEEMREGIKIIREEIEKSIREKLGENK
ncbi:MocR-like pyridoxine biosynthesis transcription factor PdxR [Oceanirhabdus sp. W0125-5]|uniref:MocR-like pyridoxine biosynthesis transcription factor PdxR n=1 Tax=Oceanirhabdus sp. W0125-5 TaxID=2999116 RepID=UPI0022F2E2D6|nr:PLP-dependent aminotransferase family protein [Oceanirhabdus sp. W0125-5]WBW99477.1 PLP-dependent aminotransferase family protein [Oceanirhabdus sp. W0125-5]